MAVGLFALTVRQLIEATVGRDDPNREGTSRAGRVQWAEPPSIWRLAPRHWYRSSVPACSIRPR